MPIWLRNFTALRISNYNKDQNQKQQKSLKQENSTSVNLGESIPSHVKQAFKRAGRRTKYTSKKTKK